MATLEAVTLENIYNDVIFRVSVHMKLQLLRMESVKAKIHTAGYSVHYKLVLRRHARWATGNCTFTGNKTAISFM